MVSARAHGAASDRGICRASPQRGGGCRLCRGAASSPRADLSRCAECGERSPRRKTFWHRPRGRAKSSRCRARSGPFRAVLVGISFPARGAKGLAIFAKRGRRPPAGDPLRLLARQRSRSRQTDQLEKADAILRRDRRDGRPRHAHRSSALAISATGRSASSRSCRRFTRSAPTAKEAWPRAIPGTTRYCTARWSSMATPCRCASKRSASRRAR